MTRMLRRATFALAVLIAGYVVLSLYVAARFTAPDRSLPERAQADRVGPNFHEVRLRATDGVGLSAWWVPVTGSSRAVILVHGWNSDRSDEGVLETSRIYTETGYSALMLDLRGHGESQNVRRTLGYREIRDVRGALGWLEKQGFDSENVVLHGWSMGGASAIRAAAQTDVAAVVAEASYADLPRVLERQIPATTGLPRPFNPGIMLAAKFALGCDPWAVRPERAASTLSERGVPLLIIHSTGDKVIPFEHARLLAAAHPDAKLWRLDGYDHVAAHLHPEYRKRILAFLKKAESEVA